MSKSDLHARFARNFNALLDLSGCPALHDGRVSYVAKLLKISRSAADKWLRGDALPDPSRYDDLCAILNTRLDSIFGSEATQVDSLRTQSVFIGAISQGRSNAITPYMSTRQTAVQGDLYFYLVDSNAMEPYLMPGDVAVFVGTNTIRHEGVYVVTVGASILIRAARRTHDEAETYSLVAQHGAGPSFPSDTLTYRASSLNIVKVVGQVTSRVLVQR